MSEVGTTCTALLRHRALPRALVLAAFVLLGIALVGAPAAGATSSASLTVVTDGSWTWTGTNGSGTAVVLPYSCYPGYNAWGSAIPSYWIWTSNCLQGDSESATFTKTFTVPGLSVTSASARFAVDNYGTLAINGQTVITRADPGFYSQNSGATDVTAYVHPGLNTLAVVGTNLPNGSPPGGNPAGVSAVLTVGYTVDDTAPADSPSLDPAPNAAGWNDSPVTVHWNWADEPGGSGIDPTTCTQTSTSSGEGVQTLAASCSDLAGNRGSDSVTVRVDGTAPVASPVAASAPNAYGWYAGDVTVAWNWSDAGGSGIDPAACTTSSTSSGEGAVTVTATCADVAGNAGTSSVVVQVDKTAPAAAPAASPAANANGWNRGDVTVAWNWSDAGGSGVDAASCTASSTSSGEGAAIPLAGSCTDLAGNTGTAGSTVRVDATAPTLAPSVSPDPVALNGSAAASANAADALSGVDSSSCGAVDTSSLGPHAVACTATDAAGNTATGTASYEVTARASKGAVLDAIRAARASAPLRDRIGLTAAALALEASLAPRLWVDANHPASKLDFEAEKVAVQALAALQRDPRSSLADATLQGWIDAIVAIDRGLATIAIADATAAGGEARKLAEAARELARGDVHAAGGRANAAVEHYGNAWQQARLSTAARGRGRDGDD